MYKLELTEEEHEFLKFCMETILSTDWYASAECMEMAEALQERLLALPKLMAEDIKVGEVYYLPVRVTSRNVNMEREYLAVEPVGMEVPELVLSPDGTRLLYVKAEQLKKGEVSMFNLDDRWDAAVIDFCRSRYSLALEPILVRTSTNELNDIYAIVPPDELHEEGAWYPLTAIYECGVVKCYTVQVGISVCKYEGDGRFIWRNPNTGEYFIPKEEIRA